MHEPENRPTLSECPTWKKGVQISALIFWWAFKKKDVLEYVVSQAGK